jgi:hypothetical protein
MTHVVEIAVNVLHDLLVAEAEADQEHNNFISWLRDREGGPLLISGITDDEGETWEKFFIALPCTSEVEAWDLWEMVELADKHLWRGVQAHTLETKAYRFAFTDANTAMLFKLAFGGSQRGD